MAEGRPPDAYAWARRLQAADDADRMSRADRELWEHFLPPGEEGEYTSQSVYSDFDSDDDARAKCIEALGGQEAFGTIKKTLSELAVAGEQVEYLAQLPIEQRVAMARIAEMVLAAREARQE